MKPSPQRDIWPLELKGVVGKLLRRRLEIEKKKRNGKIPRGLKTKILSDAITFFYWPKDSKVPCPVELCHADKR